MRTIELLSVYANRRVTPPENGWQRLVWMGAEMVRMAQIERGTTRTGKRKTTRKAPNFTQEEFFN